MNRDTRFHGTQVVSRQAYVSISDGSSLHGPGTVLVMIESENGGHLDLVLDGEKARYIAAGIRDVQDVRSTS